MSTFVDTFTTVLIERSVNENENEKPRFTLTAYARDFNRNEQRYIYQHNEGHPYDYANGHHGIGHQTIPEIADNLNRLNARQNVNAQKVDKGAVRLLVGFMQRRIKDHPKEEDDHWGRVTRPYDLEWGADNPTAYDERL